MGEQLRLVASARQAKSPSLSPVLTMLAERAQPKPKRRRTRVEIVDVDGVSSKRCTGGCDRLLPVDAFYERHGRPGVWASDCAECARRKAKPKAAERRKRLLRAGLCSMCGKSPIAAPGAVCYACWFKQVSVAHFQSVANASALRALFESQAGRCAYTGVVMRVEPGPITWDSASIEHIDPKGLNDLSNVCWVIWQVNMSKSNQSLAEYIAHQRVITDGIDERSAPRFAALAAGHGPWLGAVADNDNAIMEAPDAPRADDLHACA